MPRLSIHLLGPFQVSLNREPVCGFASDKVRALLAYLVLTPDRPHRREALAGLLWPEFPERAARNSLRNALANLRQVLRDRDASPRFLLSTRQTIQFNTQSDYWLDADAFEALIAMVPPTSEQLEQAASLGRGTFLEGFTLADASPFEEWLLLRREHFGRQLVEALDSLSAIYEDRCDYRNALVHARRRVELEPWQEHGQRQIMRLLALGGQRGEALAQYAALRRSLQEELGADPLPETQSLWEQILSGELAPQPAQVLRRPVPIWNLPSPATPFFGREEEMACLEALLFQPGIRLVTLLGLGGCGKTRLALEVGRRLAERERLAFSGPAPAGQPAMAFRHGIVFVPLSAVDSVNSLAPALAGVLRLHLEGGREQLLEYLRRRELLLILDNLEQLLPKVSLLAEILQVADGVKILATSRERLELRGEHVVTVGGLPYPQREVNATRPEAVDERSSVGHNPALELLADGVRRVRSQFDPGSADLDAMLEICRLVDGLPLALELAASWADSLSLKDILAEAQQNLGFLAADWPDLPRRQRSIRAVFDGSWRRLDPAEQAAFSAMTVFRGGFAREAAGEVVAGVAGNPRLLTALVRKSFLKYDQATDRFGVHELLRQFGAEKLAAAASRDTEVRDLHSAYYTEALQRWEADLVGSRQREALIEMEADSENIRTAWTWAVENAKVERLAQAMEGLYHFYRRSGRYSEGEAAFQLAVSGATAASNEANTSAAEVCCLRVRARALVWQGLFQWTQGRLDLAQQSQQQAEAVLDDPTLAGEDIRLERAILARCKGRVNAVDFDEARQQFEKSYGLFRELGSLWGMAEALTYWGNACAILGLHEEARRRLEEGLAICRSLGNQAALCWPLIFLAYLARMEGRFEDALLLARETHTIARTAGTQSQSGIEHLSYAVALEHLGRFQEARAILLEGVAIAIDSGDRVRHTQVHVGLVRVAMHLGQYREARDRGETGLALARAHGPRWSVGLSLLLLGCLDVAERAFARACERARASLETCEQIAALDDLSTGYTLLALATRGQGHRAEARELLLRAIRTAREIRAVPPLLWALPVAALLFADERDVERAVELYALASRYPFVANSRWFEDVAGSQIAALAVNLPEAAVTAARQRGQARDLIATVEELLSELRM